MADGSATPNVLHERWFGAAELAGLAGVPGTERRVRTMAERESWSARIRTGRGGGREYAFASLPPQTQAALLLRARPTGEARPRNTLTPTEAQLRSVWARYERAKQPMKDMAAMRLKALDTVQALVRSGMPLMQARDVVVAQLQRDNVRGASAASLARWQKAVDHAHRVDWLALLLPHYAGRTATAEMEPEAWELFKADYLRLEQPTASSCYDRLMRIAAERDWQLPSCKTFVRKLERELPRQVRVLARQGEEALDRTYPAQIRDRSMFEALDGVNSDGHRWDINVRFPDGNVGRPCILGWQDLGTGKLLAYRLGDHENADMVRLSFGDMVREFGIPRSVYLDNGRAFASKWITGGTPNRYRFKVKPEDPVGLITQLVGAEGVHWVTPYHGQAKPIERMWRDFCDRIAKHPAFAGAYVGNNPVNKPENYGERAIEWATFERVVADEIRAHNAREGRRMKACAGRSFDSTFAESYARTTVRKVSDEQLRQLLLATEKVTASPENGSVVLAGNRYWIEELASYAGKKVVLRVDPHHLQTEAHVYALDGTFISTAPCTAAVGFADVNAGREFARGKSQYRRAAKDMLAAEKLMDAAQVAAQLPDTPSPDKPSAGVIAPVFKRHAAKPKPVALAPTGTEGPTKFDLLMIEMNSARLRDEQ